MPNKAGNVLAATGRTRIGSRALSGADSSASANRQRMRVDLGRRRFLAIGVAPVAPTLARVGLPGNMLKPGARERGRSGDRAAGPG